jgi:1-acyl-sn-glycerol-3-phosphate acyltransferase
MNLTPAFTHRNPLPRIHSGRLAEKTWYHLGRLGVDALKHLLFHLDLVYETPLPRGAKLLCANHPTTLDPVMLTTLVPEQVSILISETLFKVPVLGASLRQAGHIRVVHANGRPALEAGMRCLQDGRSVGVFPEGAISPQGSMASAHTGAARMALATGAPVIPIGIALKPENVMRVKTVVDGKEEIGTWYLHGPYAISVGRPLFFHGDANDRELVRQVTAQIVQHIRELSGESARRVAAGKAQRLSRRPTLPEIQAGPVG